METRKLVIGGAEVRAAGDFQIVGKAVTYGKQAPNDRLGKGVTEMVAPGAFADCLRTSPDVKCLVNHNSDRILGRTKSGTLTLTDGPDALRFRCQLDKNSQAHRDLYAAVQRGDLNECSFAFICHDEAYQPGANGQQVRVVKKAELLDVSIVTYPFYSTEGSTSAEARHAVELNRTHGLIEAVAYLRGITKRLVIAMRGGDSSPVDFAGHLSACHEHAEMACMMAKRCDEALDDDDDADEEVKAYFRYAKAACNLAAENYASARVRHLRNLTAKQVAKALGRGR